MSFPTKKAYVYEMKLGPANLFSIVILVLMCVLTHFLYGFDSMNINWSLTFLLAIGWLWFHEIWHGIGYVLGGTKYQNVAYGICLEKGIFYCMSYQEITRKNILISLQMPFMAIGVITYIVGLIFHLPVLIVLSIFNIMGASMDLVMFYYIWRLPKDVTYSESGRPDQFVLISSEDLKKRKSTFLKIVDEKDYKSEDYHFTDFKRFTITKLSLVILIVLIVLNVINLFL